MHLSRQPQLVPSRAQRREAQRKAERGQRGEKEKATNVNIGQTQGGKRFDQNTTRISLLLSPSLSPLSSTLSSCVEPKALLEFRSHETEERRDGVVVNVEGDVDSYLPRRRLLGDDLAEDADGAEGIAAKRRLALAVVAGEEGAEEGIAEMEEHSVVVVVVQEAH